MPISPELSGDNLYAPLNPATLEVRFLKLQPGTFDQAIHCDLQACPLGHHPKYETLSYVWGDASVKKPVYVNGHLVQRRDSLPTLLLDTRGRQCTNIRDRIYGLYAFSPRLQEVYPVNYNKPSCVVMYESTAAGIWESRMFLYTSFALHMAQPIGVSIPSWALDFTQPFGSPTRIPMLFVPETTEPGYSFLEPKACVLNRAILRLPAHVMGTCSSLLQLNHDQTELAGELSRLLKKTDEYHMRIWLALASFIDLDKVTLNYLLLQSMLQYFSQQPSQRGEGTFDWGISPEVFEMAILHPLAGKSVTLLDAVAQYREEQRAPSVACIVSGSAFQGDLIVLPASHRPVMALRRSQPPQTVAPGSDAYFTPWLGWCGLKDMGDDGKRLVAATRSMEHTDFVIQ
ncbi:hypothetical protein PG994_006540 [Apiospora phragmitis]|uniref:Heterokaryon incompatibility domain-containing protein n=1 Tax=Apiospora phragmitis TaxID=2905665 RepID=A0ABR1VFC3_9PEZI